jgi:hypothetical protein
MAPEPLETWASWFRQNFDKILLFTAWIITLSYCAFLIASRDASTIAWGREMAGTVLGAFLGLVTGSRLAAHSGSASAPTVPTVPVAESQK